MRVVQSLLFPAPASVFVTVMATANFLALVNNGINEIRGKHVQYSKLMGPNSGAKIRSKAGMVVIYLPVFLFCAATWFLFFPSYEEDSRFFLICSTLTLHFLKRLLETLFVHKYSGEMALETMLLCSVTYVMFALIIIYAQYLTRQLPEPSIDLKYVGVFLFLTGMSGNMYHHYLLSALRKEGEKEYKIPKGGLFGLVVCPHYLFEVLDFWGLAFIAQTWCALGITAGITVYMFCRSHSTRKWYVSKFEDFPAHVKAVIPYVF
ncbi:hypothetical protein V2J09_001224 [Rumex salicifolius]